MNAILEIIKNHFIKNNINASLYKSQTSSKMRCILSLVTRDDVLLHTIFIDKNDVVIVTEFGEMSRVSLSNPNLFDLLLEHVRKAENAPFSNMCYEYYYY